MDPLVFGAKADKKHIDKAQNELTHAYSKSIISGTTSEIKRKKYKRFPEDKVNPQVIYEVVATEHFAKVYYPQRLLKIGHIDKGSIFSTLPEDIIKLISSICIFNKLEFNDFDQKFILNKPPHKRKLFNPSTWL